MVWSSAVENGFIAIILSHRLASGESNCELNVDLITKFEWNDWVVQGDTNDPILGVAIVGSDIWVGVTGFALVLMTSQSARSIILISCMMEKSGESDDNVIKGLQFSLIMPLVYISF